MPHHAAHIVNGDSPRIIRESAIYSKPSYGEGSYTRSNDCAKHFNRPGHQENVVSESDFLTKQVAIESESTYVKPMNETLIEFVRRRRREIDAEEERLKLELEKLHAERSALNYAERMHMRTAEKETYLDKKFNTTAFIRRGTIKEKVINILKEHKNGLVALEILAKINNEREIPLERTSLSPQLSRLRQEGILDLDGTIWRLADEYSG
jgi:hypothetical protein